MTLLLSVLALLSLAAVLGFRLLAPAGPGSGSYNGPPGPGTWRAALIVPVTGNPPGFETCLKSLLTQDYPDYTVYFALEKPDDPAAAAVNQALAQWPKGKLVLAGQAVHCGQKNHGILAGLAEAGQDAEIFMFCDGNHVAPRDFLSRLSEPVRQGRVRFSTGYHRVVPLDSHYSTLALLFCVQALRTLQSLPFLVQPWGGATAAQRQAFEELEVAKLWSTNVVDDVSLAALLVARREKCESVAGACLDSPQKALPFSVLSAWLVRQLLYLRYIMPGTFLAAALALPVCAAPFLVPLAALCGMFPLFWGLAYLAAFGLAGLWLRGVSPREVEGRAWLRGYFAVFGLAVHGYLTACLAKGLSWRGVNYDVAPGGVVRGVRR